MIHSTQNLTHHFTSAVRLCWCPRHTVQMPCLQLMNIRVALLGDIKPFFCWCCMDIVRILLRSAQGNKFFSKRDKINFVIVCVAHIYMKSWVKISAQPHTTICIQCLDRENNDKNNTLPWENRFFLQ